MARTSLTLHPNLTASEALSRLTGLTQTLAAEANAASWNPDYDSAGTTALDEAMRVLEAAAKQLTSLRMQLNGGAR